MDVVTVDAAHPDPGAIGRAAAVLQRGGLVAMPTETVYGLAVNALDADAVARVFAAKGRPTFNPLIVHLADAADLPRVARDIPAVVESLAARFWPGPLTLVLHRQPVIPDLVTGGADTVGVRVPAHAVARALIRAAGVPLAAPSANPFTHVSPTTAEHVVRGMGEVVDVVLDAGPTTVGIESTVVDLTQSPPRLLRPGGVSREALLALLPHLADAQAYTGTAVRPSPGMIERHYAPRTPLRLFAAGLLREALDTADAAARRGERVVVLARSTGNHPSHPALHVMPPDPDAFARVLYATLHALDAEDTALALVESVPDDPAWEAVRDRLRRASDT